MRLHPHWQKPTIFCDCEAIKGVAASFVDAPAKRELPDFPGQSQGGERSIDGLGEIEHLPLADASVDVVISNCVINLSLARELSCALSLDPAHGVTHQVGGRFQFQLLFDVRPMHFHGLYA